MCKHDILTKTAKAKGMCNRSGRSPHALSDWHPLSQYKSSGKGRRDPFMISYHEQAVGKQRRGASPLASWPSAVLLGRPPGGHMHHNRAVVGSPSLS